MSKTESKTEFNFDSITGGTTKVSGDSVTLPSNTEETEPEKEQTKTLGVMLTIPTDKQGVFRSIDAKICTGAEFAEWASHVYPIETLEPKIYDSRKKRFQAIKEIWEFHSNALMLSKLDPKKPTRH